MKHDDIQLNTYYKYNEPNIDPYLIYIIGRDPFSGRLVATSKDWLMSADLLDDTDIEFMESI